MKKRITQFVVCGVMVIALAMPVNATTVSASAEKISLRLTAEEIESRKKQTRVPETVDGSITGFVQYEKDIWSVLSENLNEEDYGGMYVKNDILHIKVINEKKVKELVDKIYSYVPSDIKPAEESIVYEYDAIYSLKELHEAEERLWEANRAKEISITSSYANEKCNSLSVGAHEWTEESKKKVAEISGVDSEHLIFENDSGIFVDQDKSQTEVLPIVETDIDNKATAWLISKGVIPVDYDVSGAITRGEAADIIAKSIGLRRTAGKTGDPFSDLDESHPYYNSILALYDAGIYNGSISLNGEKVALADENMTREQAAVFISCSFEGLKDIIYYIRSTAQFLDEGDISPYASEHVYNCMKNWVMRGYPDGTFKPKDGIAKPEFLGMLYRALSISEDKDGLQKSVFSDEEASPGVTMEITSFSVSDEHADFIFTNSSDLEYMFGYRYQIEVKLDGEWYSAPVRYYGIDDVGFGLKPYSQGEFEQSIRFSSFEPGEYRIIKDMDYRVSEPGEIPVHVCQYCIAYFEME